ncbi:hypothetical protein NE172_06385 [Clostridium botulinum]|uniref:Uncharacterized protein n=1 Tax=Clostridium botulinum TaxID=1491 RepID=A0A6B4JKB9_CLOBO|nr:MULTISPECIES: hypothetical protein [Clostridium]EES49762.1 conserved hypothetical protein [Clostridium botulinum E1 str. 'BoNT E Beluga']MBY6760790.1 hypothetical protein [Clostridium botulinum]MBY6919918.1 hypothetical protein [Clostridium botulinum]MCR1130576.1 hypothetical protein [Clostridium botulinum]NFJ57478.1 hypothetical protein [Clostridium botulinum]
MEKKKELQCTIKGKKKDLYFSLNFKFNNNDFLEQIAEKLESNEIKMENVHQLLIGLVKDKEVGEANG